MRAQFTVAAPVCRCEQRTAAQCGAAQREGGNQSSADIINHLFGFEMRTQVCLRATARDPQERVSADSLGCTVEAVRRRTSRSARAAERHAAKRPTVRVQKKCIENSDEPAERTRLCIAHWAMYACGQWDSDGSDAWDNRH